MLLKFQNPNFKCQIDVLCVMNIDVLVIQEFQIGVVYNF